MQGQEPNEESVVSQETVDAQVETSSEEGVQAETQPLQDALDAAQAKVDDHWNTILRMKADEDNLRKRSERDLANAHKFALEKIINELLPVKDGLEMGLGAAAAEADVEKLQEGMDLTLKMLGSALGKFGVVEIDPTGQPFNPEHHQAMSMQASDEVEPNSVLMVMQKGYLLNERLVRPAMVVVSKAPE